jgi:hypothetical protein
MQLVGATVLCTKAKKVAVALLVGVKVELFGPLATPDAGTALVKAGLVVDH